MENNIGQQYGNYRLTHLLGQGGFADVYLGEHLYLKTYAALKILRLQLTNDVMEDFLKEAQTIASLEHPHIVRILECGVEDRVPFLVMEYAPSGSLRQRHPKGSCLPLELVRSYVHQIASALQYAHEKRLIHRDIKPENILLGYANNVLLSDFGVVSFAQSTGSQTTKEMAGTIPYMAPEQLQGKPRPASDQYALGIVVYEWLSGTRPFQGSFAEIASQHLLAPPPPLHGSIPGISPEIEQVVFTALAKDPQQRFSTVQAFATAFEQVHQLAQHRQFSVDSMSTSTSWRPPVHGILLPSWPQPSVGGLSSQSNPPQSTSIVTPPYQPHFSTGGPSSGSYSSAQALPVALQAGITQQITEQAHRTSRVNSIITGLLILALVGSGLLLFGSYLLKTLTLTNMWSFLIVAVVALASLLVRLKVNRFRELLKRIETFPEAERVHMMKMELNTVTPPEMTAEQFIKFKRHPYNFAFKCLIVLLVAGLLSIVLFNFSVYRLYIAPILTGASTSITSVGTSSSSLSAFVPGEWHETIDPLSDNSKGYNWDEKRDSIGFGSCEFKNGDYHVYKALGAGSTFGSGLSRGVCLAENTNFSDFAFEVSVQVVTGVQGGIIFDNGPTGRYFFYIYRNQYMQVTLGVLFCTQDDACKTIKLVSPSSSGTHLQPGQNAFNTLGVIVKNKIFTFYVNGTNVAQMSDDYYSQGQIGVCNGVNDIDQVEIEFKMARIWHP